MRVVWLIRIVELLSCWIDKQKTTPTPNVHHIIIRHFLLVSYIWWVFIVHSTLVEIIELFIYYEEKYIVAIGIYLPTNIGIPNLKIRWSSDSLTFMVIHTPGKTAFVLKRVQCDKSAFAIYYYTNQIPSTYNVIVIMPTECSHGRS